MDECGDGGRIAFEVAHEATVSADPGERPFDDPALGQDDETFRVGSFDDLDFPASGLGDGSRHFRPLISGVGEDFRDEGEAPPRALQQTAGAVAILNIGGQDAHAEQESQRIDKDMALAPRDFLARVKPLRINRCAPF